MEILSYCNTEIQKKPGLCVLQGSIMKRNKWKQSGTSPSPNYSLNNINCALKASSHSASLTPSGRNGNRHARLLHIFYYTLISPAKLDFTPAYFHSHNTGTGKACIDKLHYSPQHCNYTKTACSFSRYVSHLSPPTPSFLIFGGALQRIVKQQRHLLQDGWTPRHAVSREIVH